MTHEIPLEDLFTETGTDRGIEGESIPLRRRGRPRGSGTASTPDKATFKEIFQLISGGLTLAGQSDLALSEKEIDDMADAWYRVTKENPALAKYVVKGRKASVWGNLLFVHLIVVGKRIELVAKKVQASKVLERKPRVVTRPEGVRPTTADQAGTTRVISRPEWQRQDDVSGEATFGT